MQGPAEIPERVGNDRRFPNRSGMTLAFELNEGDVEDVAVGGGVGLREDCAALGLVVLDVLVAEE